MSAIDPLCNADESTFRMETEGETSQTYERPFRSIRILARRGEEYDDVSSLGSKSRQNRTEESDDDWSDIQANDPSPAYLSKEVGTYFRALFPNAKEVFSRVLRLMAPSSKKCLDCNNNGIRVMSTLRSHETKFKAADLYPEFLHKDGWLDWDMVRSRLLLQIIPATDFDECHCPHRIYLGFDESARGLFQTALQAAKKDDSLLLQLDEEDSTLLKVQVISKTLQLRHSVEIPVQISMPQEVTAPQDECVCWIRMDRRRFEETINFLRFNMKSEYVTFKYESPCVVGIYGDESMRETVLQHKLRLCNDEREGSTRTRVECTDPFRQHFSSRDLGNLLNGAPECSTVEIRLLRESPCRIQFPLLEGSKLSCSGGFSFHLCQGGGDGFPL